MVDVTAQENKTNDFEAQLREIDCAIQAVDTVKESMGIRESRKKNRADTGPLYIIQTEVQGTGGKIGKATKAQLPCTGPQTASDGPFGCDRKQQEAQNIHSNMDRRRNEEGRVLRNNTSEVLLKDLIQANEPKSESSRQKTISPKKLPEKKKTPENRGKGNKPSSGVKTTQAREVQNGVNQGTWKRYRREGENAGSLIGTGSESRSKRKGTMPLKEVLEEAEEGKRCKKEEDVVLMGHLLAQHLGSVEPAA